MHGRASWPRSSGLRQPDPMPIRDILSARDSLHHPLSPIPSLKSVRAGGLCQVLEGFPDGLSCAYTFSQMPGSVASWAAQHCPAYPDALCQNIISFRGTPFAQALFTYRPFAQPLPRRLYCFYSYSRSQHHITSIPALSSLPLGLFHNPTFGIPTTRSAAESDPHRLPHPSPWVSPTAWSLSSPSSSPDLL
jgi:hypothetical protein